MVVTTVDSAIVPPRPDSQYLAGRISVGITVEIQTPDAAACHRMIERLWSTVPSIVFYSVVNHWMYLVWQI